MASPLLEQGIVLMLAGMGTVFVFLTTLVLAMRLLARVVSLLPGPQAPISAGARPEEVAAITAAIQMHRRHNGSQ